MYKLELKPRFNYERSEPENADEIKAKLNSLKSLKEKLDYFNNNIKSLAFFAARGLVYYPLNDYGRDLDLKIYCGCDTCRPKDDFDKSNEKIFLKMRYSEIERITDLLKQKKNYGEKLEILISLPGFKWSHLTIYQHPEQPPLLREEDIYQQEPVIDLIPKSANEIEIFNDRLLIWFKAIYGVNGVFTDNYKSFNAVNEIKKLQATLEKSLDPIIIVSNQIKQIEDFYGYPNKIEIPESRPVTTIDPTLDIRYFKMLAFGQKILLNIERQTELSLYRYTHAVEVFEYYKHLRELKATIESKTSIENSKKSKENVAVSPKEDEYYKNNKIKNYNLFIRTYGAFLYNAEANIRNFNKLFYLCKELDDARIIDIGHRAKQEIENLTMEPNVDCKFLIKKVKLESKKLIAHLKDVKDKNNVHHVDNGNKYHYFHSTVQPLYDFWDWYALLFLEELENKPVTSDQQSVIINFKPIFRADAIDSIFEILKAHFNSEHQGQLHHLLETGGHIQNKILFLDKGNRLLDAFKQLYENNFITGCQKKELETWIGYNFQYRHKDKPKDFDRKYLNTNISSKDGKCKNTILTIVTTNGNPPIIQRT